MDGNGNVQPSSASTPSSPLMTEAHVLPEASVKTDTVEVQSSLGTPRISVTDFSSEGLPKHVEHDQEEASLDDESPDTNAAIDINVAPAGPAAEPDAQDEPQFEEEVESVQLSPPPIPDKDTVEEGEQRAVPSVPTPPPAPEPDAATLNGHHPPPVASLKSNVLTHVQNRSMTSFQGHHMSSVLISSALETIAASKEAKRSIPLKDSTQRALELLQGNKVGENPRDILEPLRLACETRNEKLMAASLDCISKLIGFDFFADEDIDLPQRASPPPSPNPYIQSSQTDSAHPVPQPSLVDLVAHTIVSCYTETTPDTVSVQIVKAILSLVVSSTTVVHHSSLLKCIRTVYNIYMLSAEARTQQVAQAALSQMVDHIFNRSKDDDKPRGSLDRRDSVSSSVQDTQTEAPSNVAESNSSHTTSPGTSEEPENATTENDSGEALEAGVFVSFSYYDCLWLTLDISQVDRIQASGAGDVKTRTSVAGF